MARCLETIGVCIMAHVCFMSVVVTVWESVCIVMRRAVSAIVWEV